MKVIARNSNLLGKITVLVMVCFVTNTAVALDGSGTEQDPWRIKSLDDFNDFAADANYWAGFTRLETDVNLAGRVYDSAVIAPHGDAFTGVFDGNDHKITELTINGGLNDYVGLFGYVDGGEVRNLGIEAGSVSGEVCVGALVGLNYGGSISDCYSSGDVNGGDDCVGGLVGRNRMGDSISDCYSAGDVTGRSFVGGLVGLNTASISDCYSAGDATCRSSFVGGLVGSNGGGVSNCYSTGNVSGDYDVGGLVGSNGGSVSHCYSTGDVNGIGRVGGLLGKNVGGVSHCDSTGDVNGDWNVGGLVGQNGELGDWGKPGQIRKCYSTGSVSGVPRVGGLVGAHRWGRIEQSYWDIQSSNEPNMCGSQHEQGTGCDNSYGKTTAEMHQQSTFTNWDFINVWNIGENQTYPYLRVYLPSDINKDGIVNFLDVAITANQWMEEQ